MAARLIRIAIVGLLAAGLVGATVRSVDVAELADRSEFIFEGHVSSRSVERDSSSGLIFTRVRFEIIEPIKGRVRTTSLELRFLGGTHGGETLSVPGMAVPEVGEHGIYFVESLTRQQVHPLFGWSQGHFRVMPDAGGRMRVHTQTGLPVGSIEPGAASSTRYSTGVCRGIRIATRGGPRAAMTTRAFKRTIRDLARGTAR